MKKKNKLIENIFSLSLIQIAGYIFPLFTIPYLVRVLDAHGFGLLAISLAVIKYFNLVVDYGFNLSATREISIKRGNKKEISAIFWNVLACKLILLSISLIFLIILVENNEVYSDNSSIFYSMFVMVVGGVITPFWLFQGMESMREIAISNILAKILYVPSVFIFVNDKNDIWIAALLQSSVFILSGVIALFQIYNKKWIMYVSPNFVEIKKQFINGLHLFISTVSVSFYSNTFVILLSLYNSPTIVGYYSAADKIRQAVQGLLLPISQAIFPKIAKEIHEKKYGAKKIIERTVLLQGIISFLLSAILFSGADFFVSFLYGTTFIDSVYILKILAFIPFIVGLNNVFGQQIMLNFELKKEFSYILSFAGGIGCCMCYFASKYYGMYYVAGLSVFIELFVLISMVLVTYKKVIRFMYVK